MKSIGVDMYTKILFIIFLPVYLFIQIGCCFGHLLVYIFDVNYDHEIAIDTFYPIIKYYKRFWI